MNASKTGWFLTGWQRRFRKCKNRMDNVSRIWKRLCRAEQRYQLENEFGIYAKNTADCKNICLLFDANDIARAARRFVRLEQVEKDKEQVEKAKERHEKFMRWCRKHQTFPVHFEELD